MQTFLKKATLLFCFLAMFNFQEIMNDNKCQQTLTNMLDQVITKDITDKRLKLMLKYSSEKFNDLGETEFCKNHEELGISTAVYDLQFGIKAFQTLCIPNECNSDELNIFVEKKHDIIEILAKEFLHRFVEENPKKVEMIQNFLGVDILDEIKDLKIKMGKIDEENKDDEDDQDDNKKKQATLTFLDPGTKLSWTNSHTFTAVIFAVIIALNIIGTLYQKMKKSNSEFSKIECFSLTKNITKLVTVKPDKRDQSSNLNVFSGIRLLMCFWVIYAHVYGTYSRLMTNMDVQGTLFKDWNSLLIFTGFYSVDTFFYLGGFFSAYVLVQKLKDKKLTFKLYFQLIIYRALRILPAYIGLMLVLWKFLNFLGDGPLFGYIDKQAKGCDEAFWPTITLVWNFFDLKEACAGWGWYLANDFEMFFTAPLIIYILQRNRKVGFALIITLFVQFSAIQMYIMEFYEFEWNVPGTGRDLPKNVKWFQLYYAVPWMRYLPYLAGLTMGYLYSEGYFTRTEKKQKPNFIDHITNSKCKRILVSLVGFGMCVALGIGQREKQINGVWSWKKDFFYNNYSRMLFTLGINIMVLPSLTGKGYVLRSILGNRVVVIIGRLSYCMYLVHQAILSYSAANTKTAIIFNHPLNLWRAVQCLVYSIFWGFLLSMFIEVPFMQLLKCLTSKKQQNKGQLQIHIEKNELPSEKENITRKEQNGMVDFNEFELQLERSFSEKFGKLENNDEENTKTSSIRNRKIK